MLFLVKETNRYTGTYLQSVLPQNQITLKQRPIDCVSAVALEFSIVKKGLSCHM